MISPGDGPKPQTHSGSGSLRLSVWGTPDGGGVTYESCMIHVLDGLLGQVCWWLLAENSKICHLDFPKTLSLKKRPFLGRLKSRQQLTDRFNG